MESHPHREAQTCQVSPVLCVVWLQMVQGMECPAPCAPSWKGEGVLLAQSPLLGDCSSILWLLGQAANTLCPWGWGSLLPCPSPGLQFQIPEFGAVMVSPDTAMLVCVGTLGQSGTVAGADAQGLGAQKGKHPPPEEPNGAALAEGEVGVVMFSLLTKREATRDFVSCGESLCRRAQGRSRTGVLESLGCNSKILWLFARLCLPGQECRKGNSVL